MPRGYASLDVGTRRGHRTAIFKDVGNRYTVWAGCDKAEKDLDGGVMRAMMMAENLMRPPSSAMRCTIWKWNWFNGDGRKRRNWLLRYSVGVFI